MRASAAYILSMKEAFGTALPLIWKPVHELLFIYFFEGGIQTLWDRQDDCRETGGTL